MWTKAKSPRKMPQQGDSSHSHTHFAEDGSRILFREIQRFRQTWLLITLGIVGGCAIAVAAALPFLSAPPQPKHVNPISLVAGIWGVLVLGAVLILLVVCNLCVEVRKTGLFIRFFPFHRSFQRIPLEDVKTFRAVTYRPILEYGGWGIRCGWKSKAYNVSGNRGVKLEFYSGKSLLIGSQSPEEFAEALASIMTG